MSKMDNLFTPEFLNRTRDMLLENDNFIISSDEDYRLEIDIAYDKALVSITDLYSGDKVGFMADTEYFDKDYELLLLDVVNLKDELISCQDCNNLDRGIF